MDLVTRWKQLVRAEGVLSEDELEVQQGLLTQVTLEALRAGGEEREALISAFAAAAHLDPDLHDALGSVILPPAHRAARHPEEYREHPEVRFDAERMPLRAALGLPVADLSHDMAAKAEDFRSWFGGRPALVPGEAAGWQWPCRADGRPLTHVVQVDLAHEALNQGEDLYPRTGLPDDGIVCLFHALETFGWDSTDDSTAWRVLWQPQDARDEAGEVEPVSPAAPNAAPPFPINPQVVATAPTPLDLEDAGDEEWERYDRAVEWLEQFAHEANAMGTSEADRLTPWQEDYEPVAPLSRMGGFGHADTHAELTDVLHEKLPLAEEGDGYYLLFDVNPLAITDTSVLTTWFHGGRHLEVWLRRSDLVARNFTNVWCVIRTDN